MFWIYLLLVFCTFLSMTMSARYDSYPINEWEGGIWFIAIIVSILFPIGILVVIHYHWESIHWFFTKERTFKRSKNV